MLFSGNGSGGILGFECNVQCCSACQCQDSFCIVHNPVLSRKSGDTNSNNFPSHIELIKQVVGVLINTGFWLSWQDFNCLLPSITSSMLSP